MNINLLLTVIGILIIFIGLFWLIKTISKAKKREGIQEGADKINASIINAERKLATSISNSVDNLNSNLDVKLPKPRITRKTSARKTKA